MMRKLCTVILMFGLVVWTAKGVAKVSKATAKGAAKVAKTVYKVVI